MTKLGVSLVVASAAWFAYTFPARAATGPLLVVVEPAPGADVGPADVRHAIATELRSPVLSPRDSASEDSERLLVVALDGAEIRMSLRQPSSPTVTRTIAAPPERPARLRAIGWLAGNLARDQVGTIVGAQASPSLAPPVVAAATPALPNEPPPLQPETASSPKPAPPVEAARSSAPVEAIAAQATTPVPDRGPRWSVTATVGPTANLGDLQFGSFREFRNSTMPGSIYQAVIQRRGSPDGLVYGAALDIGTSIYPFMGIAGLVGSRWEHRHWFLEASAGLGLEVVRLPVSQSRFTSSSTSGTSVETVTTPADEPAFFVSGIGTFGLPVSRLFDVMAQLQLRVTSARSETDFSSAAIGVRFRLP